MTLLAAEKEVLTIDRHWHTPAALAWVKTILEERFGHAFNLQPQGDGLNIVMALPGSMRCITLTLDGATFVRADSDISCSNWDATKDGWSTVLIGTVPAPGCAQLPVPLITKNSNGWHCRYDILGLVYWMLSRQEEVNRLDLDVHGRFPATSSHAYRYGYLERPIVDEWLYILGQIINYTWPEIDLKKDNFNIKISHDVDRPSMYAFKSWGQIARMMGGHLIKRRDLRAFMRAPYIRLNSRSKVHQLDPFNTFEWIMDQSDRLGLLSAFYFICNNSDPHDADYQLEDNRIRYLMRRIHQRGHEIGLHPSYVSYNKPEMIRYEANRLRHICAAEGIYQSEWGGRMHYLRWEQPTTMQAWSDIGMNYDSTLGYADCPGFRCGTCLEYPAFNPKTHQILSLRIRPLIIMDSTLLGAEYIGFGTSQAALEKILNLKNTCKKVNGTFSLLWHNSSLNNSFERELFKSALSD